MILSERALSRAAMLSLGNILRRARTEQGLDVDEIARRIKVNAKYLQAIESDDLQSMPGGFFYKSFVRQYADALGLDPDEIENALTAVAIREEPMPMERHQHDAILRDLRPMPEHRGSRSINRLFPSIGILVAVTVACSAFYTWWHRTQVAAEARPAEVSRVLPAPVPNNTSAKAAPSTAALSAKQAPPPAATGRQAAASEQAKPEHPQAPPPSKTAQPQRPVASADRVHITLAATEDTWVRVSADGKRVFSGVLRGRHTRNIVGKENTRVWLRNAGGVRIEWNGRRIGTVGKRGEVRDVLFTRDGYQLMQKPSKRDEQPRADQAVASRST